MKRLSYLILFILFISSLSIRAENKYTGKTDTVSPFIYLNNYFNKTSHLNIVNSSFDIYIDSLLNHLELDVNETSLLNYIKDIYKLEYNDFQFLIDSILDLDSIPENMIRAIDYCMDVFFDNEALFTDFNCDINPYDDPNLYPAQNIYNNIWCNINPNPYPPYLYEKDSILELLLIDDSIDFVMPCIAAVTSKYGWRDGRMHQGIDLGIGYSLPIYNSFDGVVRFAKFYQGYGRLVIVRHYNGLETFYAHLSRIIVKPGQKVNAGEILGRAGNSGHSNGTHLHYEMRYKGIPLNPAHLISFTENKLIYDKIILKKIKQNYFVYNDSAILYSVQSGDYLYKIAKEYGVTVQHLCEINDLSKNSKLRVGQLIKICL